MPFTNKTIQKWILYDATKLISDSTANEDQNVEIISK